MPSGREEFPPDSPSRGSNRRGLSFRESNLDCSCLDWLSRHRAARRGLMEIPASKDFHSDSWDSNPGLRYFPASCFLWAAEPCCPSEADRCFPLGV
jgi:hypothetical protein